MLVGMNPTDQSAIDRALIDFDGTSSLSKLGANTLLAISFCCARAGAAEKEVPLFQHIADLAGCKDLCLPVPIFTAISGGRLSSNNLNYQEIQICPIGAKDVTEAVRMGAETFRALREAVEERFGWQAALVTDQGTLAPPMANIEDAIDSVCQAIEKAGHSTDAVKLAIVVGASELTMKPGSSEGGDGDNEAAADAATDEAVDAEEGGKAQEEAGKPQQYNMATFNKDAGEDQIVDSNELYEDYRALLEKYPDLIVSLEDPFGRKDWSAFSRLTSEFGENLQVLGDELFTSNAELIAKGVETSACNAALVRPNQLGTVSDIIRTSQLAQGSGWGICLAAADGESTDDFAADLNVGLQMGQLKIGAPCRGENVAKLNRLIRIEEECIDKRLDVSFAGTRFRYPVQIRKRGGRALAMRVALVLQILHAIAWLSGSSLAAALEANEQSEEMRAGKCACPSPCEGNGIAQLMRPPDMSFTLSWRLCAPCDDSDISPASPPHVSMRVSVAKSASWFGIGWRPQGEKYSRLHAMLQRDILVFNVHDNGPDIIVDMYTDRDATPKIDKKFSLKNVSRFEKDGRAYFQFFRDLETHDDDDDDDEDHAFDSESVFDWIYTLSNSQEPAPVPITEMPATRGKFALSLSTHRESSSGIISQEISDSAVTLSNVKFVHGVYMTIGWIVLVPPACIIARYTRHYRQSWLNEHVALTKLSAGGTIGFIIIGITSAGSNSSRMKASHTLLGISIAVIVLLLGITGRYAKLGLKREAKERAGSQFHVVRIVHNVLGWISVAMGLYQVPLGYKQFYSPFLAESWQITLYGDSGSLLPGAIISLVSASLGTILILTLIFLECKRCRGGYYESI
eukprot:g1875.t1